MSTLVWTNSRFFLGGYELSGIQNRFGIDYGAEMLDGTVFDGSDTRKYRPGLKNVSITGGGFWDDDYDEALFNRIAASREIVSVAPEGQAVGDRVFMLRGVNGAYNPITGGVGELLGFEIDLKAAQERLVRGVVADLGVKTATGDAAGVELGALSADQVLVAALHVVGPVSGTTPTLDVIIESDADDTWASPTTRITFTQADDIGAQWATVAGAITDTWWRASITVGGTDPSFPVFVSFGIY